MARRCGIYVGESSWAQLKPILVSLVDAYQNEIVSPNRKELLIRFLQEKTDMLKNLVTESKHE